MLIEPVSENNVSLAEVQVPGIAKSPPEEIAHESGEAPRARRATSSRANRVGCRIIELYSLSSTAVL